MKSASEKQEFWAFGPSIHIHKFTFFKAYVLLLLLPPIFYALGNVWERYMPTDVLGIVTMLLDPIVFALILSLIIGYFLKNTKRD